MQIKFILLTLFFGVALSKRAGYGPGLQDWGFIDVREGAHMFWWLLYTSQNITEPTDKPLVIWIQGGPGTSASGTGFFKDIGPIDMKSVARVNAWTKEANILFIDSPVGVGFSYVDSEIYLAQSEEQYVSDLVKATLGFYEYLPSFNATPLHIFGEGYGAKIAIQYAASLKDEISKNSTSNSTSNLKSVSLISPWVSPTDSIIMWPSYLQHLGCINTKGFDEIMTEVSNVLIKLSSGDFVRATEEFQILQNRVSQYTNGVDFMNIINPTTYEFSKSIDSVADQSTELRDFMRSNVSSALNISSNIVWGSQSGYVYNSLAADFLVSAKKYLNSSITKGLKVSVINGQLDLMVPVMGTYKWVNESITNFDGFPRYGIGIKDILEGYRQIAGNFSMYWINRAGHFIQRDNPAAMQYILNRVLNNIM